MNAKSKEELIAFLGSLDDQGGDTVSGFVDDLQDTGALYKALFELVDTATLRVIVALSTMFVEPQHRHRFTETGEDPAPQTDRSAA